MATGTKRMGPQLPPDMETCALSIKATNRPADSKASSSLRQEVKQDPTPRPFIDLTNDSRAVMKALPPDLDPPQNKFPRFLGGDVYIIIHPTNPKYQYRFYSSDLLERIPVLRTLLTNEVVEADWYLKEAKTTAEYRLETIYNAQRGRWALKRMVRTIIMPASCLG